MNCSKWLILAFVCFYWAILTPIVIGLYYGFDITPSQLPLELYIFDAISFVFGNFGFVLFLFIALIKDKYE